MNTYADAIRRQAEDAPRAALPAVAKALWTAFAAGQITEAEAEALAAMIEARQVSAKSGVNPAAFGRGVGSPNRADQNLPAWNNSRSLNSGGTMSDNPISPSDCQRSLRTGTGSRPRTDASMERRRRWAASGRLPPALASRFTLAEQAVLALIAAETARRGDCRLAIEHLATLAGVSRSTVKSAIREARKLGLLTVEERRLTGFRNDTNVVRIVSPEWTAWLRLARRGIADRDPLGRKGVTDREPHSTRDGVQKRHPIASRGVVKRHPLSSGGGVKSSTCTPTQVLKQGKTRPADASQRRIARAGKPS